MAEALDEQRRHQRQILRGYELRLLRCTLAPPPFPPSPPSSHINGHDDDNNVNRLHFLINEMLNLIESGNYLQSLSSDAAKLLTELPELPESCSADEAYSELVEHVGRFIMNFDDEETACRMFLVLCVAIAAFFFFTQCNITGPINESPRCPLPFKVLEGEKFVEWENWARNQLMSSGCHLLGKFSDLQFVVFAKLLIMRTKDLLFEGCVSSVYGIRSISWWLARVLLVQQRTLDELSSSLFDLLHVYMGETLHYFGTLEQVTSYWDAKLRYDEASCIVSMVHLEAGIMEHTYGRVDSCRLHFGSAEASARIQLSVTGALGYRTVHQAEPTAQRVLLVNRSALNSGANITCSSIGPRFQKHDSTISEDTPQLQEHETSDVLMVPKLLDNGIGAQGNQSNIPGGAISLTAIEQAVILAQCFLIEKSSRHDELQRWDMAPFIEKIDLQSSSLFIIQCFCNLLRFRWESTRSRTKERALGMMEKLDLTSGRMIDSAKQSGGLYFFDGGSESGQQSQPISTCFESSSVSNNDIMLWHFRLGHPSFRYLKHLFPKLFYNKDPSLFHCEMCEFAKHHRTSFPSQPYKLSKPFTIIHSDVWGPNRINTLSNKKWFITFTDDHTRLCWVYLLKEKSEVEQVFKNFYNMVQTQFHTNIQIFKSDNGKEYFNTILRNFFLEKGIIHHSSCIDTPQQNGVAERKNRHLLEVTRALLFTTKVPKYLWGEAVLTAAYLINRMPSKVLHYQTPFQVFTKILPTARISADLPLKIFGCTTFVHEHRKLGKLESRAIKCAFIGYSPIQKGYKCFDPISKKLFVTMDVMFFEKQHFFQNTHLQGENYNEDSIVKSCDNLFSDDVFISQSQDFEFESNAPTANGQDSFVETPFTMSDVSHISKPTFESEKSDQQSFETENKEQPTIIPQYNTTKTTTNRFTEGDQTWKGIVYSKKNHKQRKDESALQHDHDSELRTNQQSESSTAIGCEECLSQWRLGGGSLHG